MLERRILATAFAEIAVQDGVKIGSAALRVFGRHAFEHYA